MQTLILNTIIQYFTKFGPDHWMVILTFIAISITAVTFIKNQKFIRKQQFESTFFNMLKLQQEITNELEFRDRKGRILFFKMFEDMQVFINKKEYIDIINKISKYQNIKNPLVYSNINSSLFFSSIVMQQ